MGKWLAGLAVLAALGALLWQVRGSAQATRSAAKPVEEPAAPAPVAGAPASRGVKQRPPLPPPKPGQIDRKSEDFIEYVDDVIPVRLLAASSDCARAGDFGNQKIRLAVELRVQNGEVFVAETKVLFSDVQDAELQKCIVSAVSSSRWPEARIPDWAGDDELLIRIESLKKYREDLQDAEEED